MWHSGSERILKIGLYLAKIMVSDKVGRFLRHGVEQVHALLIDDNSNKNNI